MTDRLSEIEARLNVATAGPWEWLRSSGYPDNILWLYGGPSGGPILEPTTDRYDDPRCDIEEPNADLIAHAPDDLRYLLERVRELEKRADST